MENNKTRAIKEAKEQSLVLFSKNINLDIGSQVSRKYMDGIIDELNIDTSKTKDLYDIYDALVKSGLTISLYDIIEWFNGQYNLIREKSRDLPELIIPVYKEEKGKEEEAHLIVIHVDDNSIDFGDLNESPYNEYFRRCYTVDKKKGNYICLSGAGHFETVALDSEKKELLGEYLIIAQDFKEYLKAFSYFHSTNNLSSTYNYYNKGVLGTAIFGTNPFKNLEQFFVHYGSGGNVDGYFFNYELGKESLPSPTFRPWHSHMTQNPESYDEDISDIINSPHVLAKTLRVRKGLLPFEIKNN